MKTKVVSALMACGLLAGIFAGAVVAKGVKAPFHVDVTFDGYCDGQSIDVSKTKDPNKAHKKSKLLSGHATGCIEDPLTGYWTKGKKGANTATTIIDFGGGFIAEWHIHSNHTWEVFVGGAQVNAGTWTGGLLAPTGLTPSYSK